MSKYVYTEKFHFIIAAKRLCVESNPEKVRKEQLEKGVYIISTPLTAHPYLSGRGKEDQEVKSSRIKSLVPKDGFWEAKTASGTTYRLITE